MAKVRIDIYLVHRGLVQSRTKAQDAIKSGLVKIKKGPTFRLVLAANELIDSEDPPEVTVEMALSDRFVSRSGQKLDGALQFLNLDIEGFKALDVGISTGGFTDCMLQRGVAGVVGIDVGHGQLHSKIISDKKVQLFEGLNARELPITGVFLASVPLNGFDLIVVDVSFISLTLVLPTIVGFLGQQGHVVALVKPQFEVGPSGLNKKGIVTNKNLYGKVHKKVEDCVLSLKGKHLQYFEADIEGKDGNKEFFIYFKKT